MQSVFKVDYKLLIIIEWLDWSVGRQQANVQNVSVFKITRVIQILKYYNSFYLLVNDMKTSRKKYIYTFLWWECIINYSITSNCILMIDSLSFLDSCLHISRLFYLQLDSNIKQYRMSRNILTCHPLRSLGYLTELYAKCHRFVLIGVKLSNGT